MFLYIISKLSKKKNSSLPTYVQTRLEGYYKFFAEYLSSIQLVVNLAKEGKQHVLISLILI